MFTKFDNPEEIIGEMKKAGVQYGHRRTRNNPKANGFAIKGTDNIVLIDLQKTVTELEKALQFIYEQVKSGKIILFVGTRPGMREAIKGVALKYNFPYVAGHWLGGTLTNFSTLSERIKYLKKLEEDKNSGNWDKYTKKEQYDKAQELQKLEEKFDGLKEVKKVPDILFTIDPQYHKTAVREAQKLSIPIIAILDTDDDPNEVQYPIPANDSAKSAIDFIFSKIDPVLADAIKQQKMNASQESIKPTSNPIVGSK